MSTSDSPADGTDAPTDDISPEEAEQLVQEIERRRSLRGTGAILVSIIGILFSTFQMFIAAQGFEFGIGVPFLGTFEISLQLLQANAVHVGFALVLTFLIFPPTTNDGFLTRRLSRLKAGVTDRFGSDSPVTRVTNAAGRGLAWGFADPDRRRVTPVDGVLIVISLLTAAYFITDFEEIRRMRAFGLEFGRPLPEVFTFLEPVLGGAPIVGEYSYAFILGVLGVLLVLEATRRTLGLPLMIIVASFIVYARWGHMISASAPFIGVLSIPELDWSSIIQNLWYNTENGVFGIPVTVSVQFIYIFILFGSFLEMSGAGEWFIDLAYSLTGHRKGGPAKASILASGFMGTISGSSIANTVTTGAFTIPLMKRSGYSPEFSGAVEASASSGGQILPPVMGAAAFLIVQYTATPFADVIVVAAIPAIVFFFGVWVMVHLKATAAGIGGVSDLDTVDTWSHLKRGWFYLAPIVLLLYYLIVVRLSVARSAWYTLVAISALIALVAAYSDETRGLLGGLLTAIVGAELISHMVAGVGVLGLVTGGGGAGRSLAAAVGVVLGNLGWYILAAGIITLLARPNIDPPLLNLNRKVPRTSDKVAETVHRPSLGESPTFQYLSFIGKSMDEGARTAVPVVIAVAAAGIIPGVISVSGLGPNLTALLLDLSGGSLVVMLAVTAVACIILGMGMPTTVTYIILVSMLSRPLIEFGIPELAAHLFILYFGVIADITPPVAVAAYAASGVAKSDPFETGVKAFSLSLNKAIVPFAFVLTPGIVLLRRKENADALALTEQFRVVGGGDLADLAYSVPEILIPVAGVFVGVVALGATIIGYLYTEVSSLDRAGFALSSVLLMAPGLLYTLVFDVLELLGTAVSVDTLALDITLRGVGLVLFVALALKNRRRFSAEQPRDVEEEESAKVA